MTAVCPDLDTHVVFPEAGDEHARRRCSPIIRRQLHTAETEKYAHVTYFFNGGREEEWPGETECSVQSPRDVAGYDEKAGDVGRPGRRRGCRGIGDGYAFCVVNFANPDMVGHTVSSPR